MREKGLLDKILFLFSVAKSKSCSAPDMSYILELTKEHSEHRILGRFMGYSISDYALATLKWISTAESTDNFNRLMTSLPDSRRKDVFELIDRESYKEV